MLRVWRSSEFQFDFEGVKLSEAIRLTFERRGTSLPIEIEAFTDPFMEAKQTQWAAFQKRLRQDNVPTSFRVVANTIDGFISPIIKAGSPSKPRPNWSAPGPWTW